MRTIRTTIKITTKAATTTKKIMTTRTTIILINKTLAYVNQNYLIFLDAQNVANIIIKDDGSSKHRNLINKNEGVYYIRVTFAGALIAFTLT